MNKRAALINFHSISIKLIGLKIPLRRINTTEKKPWREISGNFDSDRALSAGMKLFIAVYNDYDDKSSNHLIPVLFNAIIIVSELAFLTKLACVLLYLTSK